VRELFGSAGELWQCERCSQRYTREGVPVLPEPPAERRLGLVTVKIVNESTQLYTWKASLLFGQRAVADVGIARDGEYRTPQRNVAQLLRMLADAAEWWEP